MLFVVDLEIGSPENPGRVAKHDVAAGLHEDVGHGQALTGWDWFGCGLPVSRKGGGVDVPLTAEWRGVSKVGTLPRISSVGHQHER